MVLPTSRHGSIDSQIFQVLRSLFAAITTIERMDDFLRFLAVLINRWGNSGSLKILKHPLGNRNRLLFVVGLIDHFRGYDDLVLFIHAGLSVAGILLTLVLLRYDLQVGIGEFTSGFVFGNLRWLGRCFSAAFLAPFLRLIFFFSSSLTQSLGGLFCWFFRAIFGFSNFFQSVFSSCQFLGQLVSPTRTANGVFGFIGLFGLVRAVA